MKHRIFLAINLPEKIKKELSSFQSKWPELPIRWTRESNLHITLEFLGYISDDELLKVFQNTKEQALKHKPFTITLNKICYGPPKRSSNSWTPRMIWVMGEKVQELDLLPHITLGRIRTWDFRKIEPDEVPQVNEDINLSFDVKSIEVMESVLKKGGPEYTILESFQLI